MPAQRLAQQPVARQAVQTFEALAHVRGPRRQIDSGRRPPAKHAYRSSTPSNCTKVRKSNPRPTSMRRPPGNATARPLLPRLSSVELAPDTSTVTQRFPGAALPLPLSITGQRGQAQPVLAAEFNPAHPAAFVLARHLLGFRASPPAPNFY